MKFPDFIHSQFRLPDTGMRSNNMQWDFWTLSPESAHQVIYLMGDRGTPRTWRHMNGYASSTYMWENAAGEKFWVKYHFKAEQGVQNFTDAEARAMFVEDLDYHRRDLWDAIARKDYPAWRLEMQIMPFEDAANYRFNPFDITKVWPCCAMLRRPHDHHRDLRAGLPAALQTIDHNRSHQDRHLKTAIAELPQQSAVLRVPASTNRRPTPRLPPITTIFLPVNGTAIQGLHRMRTSDVDTLHHLVRDFAAQVADDRSELAQAQAETQAHHPAVPTRAVRTALRTDRWRPACSRTGRPRRR